VSRFEAWLFHVSNGLVVGSGLAYAWAAYLAESDDPLGAANHPLQPALQHAHILLAPLAIFAGGVIWKDHVWARVRSGTRPRRWSGLSLAITLAPMIASGYLIQVATQDAWRRAFVAVHLTTSALWIAGYAVHAGSALLRRQTSEARSGPARTLESTGPTRG
jgi:hypothetical protein